MKIILCAHLHVAFLLGVFTGQIRSGLESPDIRTELIGLEKFGPDFDPIDGRIGRFGWNLVKLGSGWVKIVNFSVILSG